MSSDASWITQTSKDLVEFYKNSEKLVRKCKKPDMAEFKKIATAVGTGMTVMGFVGFFVKIVHIPINMIIGSN
jgi:protein translocase SEC61 complex gamma subunit